MKDFVLSLTLCYLSAVQGFFFASDTAPVIDCTSSWKEDDLFPKKALQHARSMPAACSQHACSMQKYSILKPLL